MNYIKKIFNLLTSEEKKKSFFLLILILIMAILDMAGVASILPFITILGSPELVESNIVLSELFEFSKKIGVSTIKEFTFVLGIFVFFILIISLSVRGLTQYAQIRFALMREYTLSRRLIEGYLHQPYSFFLKENSADFAKNILSEVREVIEKTILPFITLIAQSVVTIALLALLIFIDPVLAITVGLALALSFFGIFLFINKFLKNIGIERLEKNSERFIAVSEAFGAIKEVKFKNLEKLYIKRYANPAKIYAKHQASALVISQLARYVIEAIAFGSMIILVLILMYQNDYAFKSIVPILAIYAFAGYRLMPALQQIYFAGTQLRFSGPSLDILYNDLKNLKYSNNVYEKKLPIQFKKEIYFDNVSFRYSESDQIILKNISFNIPVYKKIGLVGSSGSGKTTIVDIVMGLLTPKNGHLKVDGIIIDLENVRSWQKNIGYVPQQIYLSDSTIAANIAFGVNPENIDMNQIEKVSKIANLHDFVLNQLPNSYETFIGERGVRLSGGQKQRIGIARALYHNPKILILDEATSALDNLTEKIIMKSVNELSNKTTIILIAHRLSTVKNCDKIFVIKDGEIKAQGNYDELSKSSKEFMKISIN